MYKKILVPIVIDEQHDTQASYLVARALADKDAEFVILHVVEEIPGYISTAISNEILQKTREGVRKLVIQSARALPGATAKVITGHAGRTIVDYASENGIDCIVMASHQPGLEDFLLGSTASRVVRHAKCSVHVIR